MLSNGKSSSFGDGVYIFDSTSVQIVNLTCEGGLFNGLSLQDDGSGGFQAVTQNAMSNVFFKSNSGWDIFASGTNPRSYGNTITNGQSNSPLHAAVSTVSSNQIPMVRLSFIGNLANPGVLLGTLPAFPSTNNGMGGTNTVQNPFLCECPVTATGGTITGIWTGASTSNMIKMSSGPGTVYLPVGWYISLDYTGSPGWTWEPANLPSISNTPVYNAYPFNVTVYVQGGTGGSGSGGSAGVLKNGTYILTSTTSLSCIVNLSPGDSITIIFYTAAPTWLWDAAW